MRTKTVFYHKYNSNAITPEQKKRFFSLEYNFGQIQKFCPNILEKHHHPKCFYHPRNRIISIVLTAASKYFV
jgi:hypothetical protein